MTDGQRVELAELKETLARRERSGGFKENVREIRQRIAELEGLE